MLSVREVKKIREGYITVKQHKELTYNLFLIHVEYSIAMLAANEPTTGMEIQVYASERPKYTRIRDQLQNLGYVTNFSYFPAGGEDKGKLDIQIHLEIGD